jgi:DNA-binding NtrC family response regulator
MPRRVLVADDDQALARAFERVLVRAGFEVDSVHDGRDALERVHATTYDVVATDLTMPHIDGLLLVLAMRAHGIATPVILLTGHADVQALTGLAPGIIVFVKPFALAAFVDAVEQGAALNRA